MKLNKNSCLLTASILLCGCSAAIPLHKADDRINALAYGMADYCFNPEKKSTDITSTLILWKELLDEIYKGGMEPDSDTGRYNYMDTGLELTPYPEDADVAGATVGVPLQATLAQFTESLLWPDWLEVFTDPLRYYVYEREYTVGDREEFLAGNENYLETYNYQEDVGQSGISFAYYTTMTFERILPSQNPSLPEEGVLIVCNMMDGEAQRVAGGYNAYMTDLYSFNIYYPISESVTYRINGTWLRAGGSLWIFGAGANSGNVGEGILDEIESLMNWITSHY